MNSFLIRILGVILIALIPAILVVRGCSPVQPEPEIELETEPSFKFSGSVRKLQPIRRNLILIVDDSASLDTNDPKNLQFEFLNTFLALCQNFAPDSGVGDSKSGLAVAVMTFSTSAQWEQDGGDVFWDFSDPDCRSRFQQYFFGKKASSSRNEIRRGPFSDFHAPLQLLDQLKLSKEDLENTTVLFITDGVFKPFPGNPNCYSNPQDLLEQRRAVFLDTIQRCQLNNEEQWRQEILQQDLLAKDAYEVFGSAGRALNASSELTEFLAEQVLEHYSSKYELMANHCRSRLMDYDFDKRNNQCDFFVIGINSDQENQKIDEELLNQIASSCNSKAELKNYFQINHPSTAAQVFGDLCDWTSLKPLRPTEHKAMHEIEIGSDVRSWALLAIPSPSDSSSKASKREEIRMSFGSLEIDELNKEIRSSYFFMGNSRAGGTRRLEFESTGHYILLTQRQYDFRFSKLDRVSLANPKFECVFAIFDTQSGKPVDYDKIFGDGISDVPGKIRSLNSSNLETGKNEFDVTWSVRKEDGRTIGWSLDDSKLAPAIIQSPGKYELTIAIEEMTPKSGGFSSSYTPATLNVVPATVVKVLHPNGKQVKNFGFFGRNLAPRIW